MHKKLSDDLTSLAHSILRMKNKDDVFALKEKAHDLYEKLSVLAYAEEFLKMQPQTEEAKEELLISLEESFSTEKKEEIIIHELGDDTALEEDIVEVAQEEEGLPAEIITEDIFEPVNTVQDVDQPKNIDIIEQPFDELQSLLFADEELVESVQDSLENVLQKYDEPIEKEEVVELIEEKQEELNTEVVLFSDEVEEEVENEKEEIEETVIEESEEKIKEEVIEEKKPTLEDELADTISVDVMANLFEKVEPKRTIHDKLQHTIRIDLNDRIAFVKHLFDGNQEDFNRVLSQLNTTNTEKEAKDFIKNMVKPDYDWSDKEEYELRLIEIIERKFAS